MSTRPSPGSPVTVAPKCWENPRLLKSGHHDAAFYEALWSALREKRLLERREIWNRRKNGETYAEMKTISAVRDEQGRIRQYVALFSDIT